MKKTYTFIILSILLFGLRQSFAQCTPMFSDGCSIALHSFGLSYSPTSTMLIEDTETACSGPSSSGVINVTAGYTYNFSLNVFSVAGSDNTSAFFSIFLDKNNDGDFEDADERLYYNNSTEIFKSGFGSPDFFSDAITIPADATTGVDLKFRVLVVAANDLGGGCNTDPSDACGTYCGGEIHDYTLNIAPVPICPLIFINGCSIALHDFSLASVTPALTLINNLETSCSGPEGNPIINVKAGENYNFDLTVYSAGGSDNVSAFFSIWLDKNNDGDFADTGERLYYNNTTQIYKSGYGPPENASGSITIPTDALTGTDLKFRVLVVAANDLGDGCNTDPNNACGLYCGGEVHDYLFNIAPPDCITPNTPTVSDVTTCAGSNVTLTATCATGTPSWYDSSTAITALNSGNFTINNVTAPGVTYYVACETSVTCVSSRVTQSTIVTEIPSPPTATGQTICSGTTASLTATCTTGTAKWYESNTSTTVLGSGNYTTPNLTNSTNYFVACESGGVPNCVSARTTQVVTVNDLPSPPTAAGQTICSGTTASLTANCTTGTAKWYESNTSTTILGSGNYTTPILTSSTTYYVACESGGVPNCVSARTAQVVTVNDLPTPPTAVGQTICNGTTTSLTANCTTGTAKWYESNTSTTVLGSGNYTTPNLTSSTTYYVACESGGVPNCVSAKTAQVVTVNDLPSPPTAAGQTICSGSTASLTANCTTGIAKWYESNTSTTVLGSVNYTTPNLTNSTNYFVACESGGVLNCVSARITQMVTVNNLPNPPTTTGQTICSGTTASLTANCTTGNAKWYESNTSTTVLGSGNYTTPNLTNSTNYFVACESGGVPNCVSVKTAQVVTVNDLPSPPTATGQTICSGTTASLTANCTTGSAKWYESNTSTTVLGSGNYTTSNLTTSTTYFVACESGGVPNCVSARITQIVTVNDLPSSPTATGQTICSGTTASLTANCTTGSAKWYESNTSTTVLGSGNYTTSNLTTSTTYFVACESGRVPNCVSARITQIVTVNDLPSSPTATGQTICSGTTASLTANCTTGTAKWYESNTSTTVLGSGNYTTPNLTNSTNYFVACESGGVPNCVSARTAQMVTANDLPSQPTATGQTICSGTTASLTANCTTGTAKWYESNTSTTVLGSGNYTTPNLTSSTTYYVACESGGVPNCVSARISQMVNINPLPIIPVISANKTSLCNSETATLSATGANGSIRWSNGSTGTSLTVSSSGTYSAVCINTCGTSPSSNMVVITTGSTPPAPVISSNKTIMCDRETARLTASGCSGQLQWSTGATTSTIELSISGTFGATCVNFCGESGISNLVTLRTGVSPTTPTIAMSSPILCGETSKILIATGCNGQIRWNTNSTGSTLNVTTAGTYTAVCETICGVSPRGNILNVQFPPNPIPTATNTGPYEIGQKIQLSATGGNTYLWRGPNDFLSTNANVSILNAGLDDRGVYTVTVTNTAGCTATATSNVVVNPCSQMFKYDYVKAGNTFEYFFPITDGMTINAMSINTGIIATPICQLDTVNTPSVRIQMTGPEPLYNRDIIENIYPYSPFENRWFQIFGPIFPVGDYTLTVTGYSQEYAQGNVMFGPQTIRFTIVGNSTSITMAQNNISEICAGSSFNISFESTGDFLSGNIFEVQLSNANGSFEVPIKIGESTVLGVVNCQIPTNIPAGNGYKTRIFATKPAQMSNSSNLGFKINPRNISLQSPTDDISALVNKKAGEKITAVNKVQIGGNATFQAGRSINLEAGFSVSFGAIFKAEIGACN